LIREGYVSSGGRRRRGNSPRVAPAAEEKDLQAHARDYLEVNCAYCHQANSGGLVNLDLRGNLRNDQINAL
jgi:mono/diheme cytochrome c family protein